MLQKFSLFRYIGLCYISIIIVWVLEQFGEVWNGSMNKTSKISQGCCIQTPARAITMLQVWFVSLWSFDKLQFRNLGYEHWTWTITISVQCCIPRVEGIILLCVKNSFMLTKFTHWIFYFHCEDMITCVSVKETNDMLAKMYLSFRHASVVTTKPNISLWLPRICVVWINVYTQVSIS